MQSVAQVLNQIKEWAHEHAQNAVGNLREPASEGALQQLKALLPSETPVELFELLSIHDGEDWDTRDSILPDSMFLLSSELIIESYNYTLSRPQETLGEALRYQEQGTSRVNGPVIPYAHHPGRIPFAAINYEIFWKIDLVPGEGGIVGQIVLEDLEDGRWSVVAPSLGHLLRSYLVALKAGFIDVDEDGYLKNEQAVWARAAWIEESTPRVRP